MKAGELVGKIYSAFQKQYNDPTAKKSLESLNILCVRLVFCLYAEDAGLFENKDSFTSYLSQYEPKDMRTALINLFKVLDTPDSERPDMYFEDELLAFPYVNGGLFAKEDIVISKLTQEIKDTILEASGFNWSEISPTIFGAVFESTLNPETRRSGGIHEYYEPEELVGKTAIAIVNLPPRKMMGIDSEGMLISAVHEEDGHEGLNLLMVNGKIPAGAKLY